MCYTMAECSYVILRRLRVIDETTYTGQKSHLNDCVLFRFKDFPRAGVHAQARVLPPGHETGEPLVLRPGAGQDRRLRSGPGDPIASPVHRLRVHPVVSSTRSAVAFDKLQHTN